MKKGQQQSKKNSQVKKGKLQEEYQEEDFELQNGKKNKKIKDQESFDEESDDEDFYEEGEEEYSDDEEEDSEEIQQLGKRGKQIKQQKKIIQKNNKNNQDESDRDSDLIEREEEEELSSDHDLLNWGSQKDIYHKDSDESASDSEELEQEKEAERIYKYQQKRLHDEDYLEDYEQKIIKDDLLEGDDDEQQGEKKVQQLNEEDRQEIKRLQQEFDKYNGILKENKELLEIPGVNSLVQINRVSYLQMFNELIQSYLLSIEFYVYLKIEGIVLSNHPVVDSLLNLKEKLGQMEQKQKKFQNLIILKEKQRKGYQDGEDSEEKDQNEQKQKQKKKMGISKKIKKENKKTNLSKNQQQGKDLLLSDEEDYRIMNKKNKNVDQVELNLGMGMFDDSEDFSEGDLDEIKLGPLDNKNKKHQIKNQGNEEISSEDEFYKSTKEQRNLNKSRLKEDQKLQNEKKKQIQLADYQVREIKDEDDARKINQMIMKNQGGMYRKRGKKEKNGRVKHKLKYEKALQKLKSQGKFIREKAKKDFDYKGETTGIKPNVVRAVSLNMHHN